MIMDQSPENMTEPKNIEGFDMLNKSKQEEIEAKFREQKKVSPIHVSYFWVYGPMLL